MPHPTAFIHPMAFVDGSVSIGARTKVWQFASIIRGAVLGEDCTVASGTTIDGSRFGDRCIICHNVAMGPGFVFGDDVFIGPNATICNDMWPRSSKEGFDVDLLRNGFTAVLVEDGAGIGANAVILPGVRIGRRAMVAAGAVVSRDVPPDSLWQRNGKVTPCSIEERKHRMREVRWPAFTS